MSDSSKRSMKFVTGVVGAIAVVIAAVALMPDKFSSDNGAGTPAPESVSDLVSLSDKTLKQLTWETIYKANHGVQQATISPDGQHLSLTATTPDARGIFHMPFDGGTEPQFWVNGRSPVWFSDSTRILYAYDGDLWTVGVGSYAPTRLTDDEGDEQGASPSPDGKYVAYYSMRSGMREVWVASVDGSTPPRKITENVMAADDFRYAPTWSPDSRKIAYLSNKGDYWSDDTWVVDIETGLERRVSSSFMVRSNPVWSPDGKTLAVLGAAKDGFWYHDLADIYLVDPATGDEKSIDMQVYATEVAPVIWSADGQDIYFPYQERAETELWRVPAKGGVATRITSMGGAFRSFDAPADTSGFVFVRSTSTRGNEVDYVSNGGGAVRRLTSLSTRWASLVDPVEVSYRSYDGLYIQGFMFTPPDFDESRKYPALVMVHGGGTNSHLKRLSLTEQKMAQEGYVVLAVNYRGGSGFGREFQDLSINDWANGQAIDAAEAASFIRAQPWSDGKVGIYGYSYGGITSMAAIARAPDVFDAAVPMAGIYDFADAYRNADRVGKVFIRTGHNNGSPEDEPEIYAISDTLARISNIKTPVLVMHGEADVRAPFRQYQLVVDILEKEGKVFKSVSYPGEPHGFRNPDNRIDLYANMQTWFDIYLKGR